MTASSSGFGGSDCSGVISAADNRSGGAGGGGAAVATAAAACCCCAGGSGSGRGRGPRSGDAGSDLGSLLRNGRKLRSIESDDPAGEDGGDDDGEDSISIASIVAATAHKNLPPSPPRTHLPLPVGEGLLVVVPQP
uniref:Uncharacterized protein n=1 Tax=Arundo donax TaxID=35708 RepID=A0A0A9DKI5_ARUDO